MSAWLTELGALLLLALLFAVIGAAFDMSWQFALLIPPAWMAWHLFNLARLVRLIDGRKGPWPTMAPGLWGQVFYQLQRRWGRSSNRKKRIRRLLKAFSSSAKALPEPTLVLDDSFSILWTNRAARRILGLKKSDVGHIITDLVRQPAFLAWITGTANSQPLFMEAPGIPDTSLRLQLVPYGQEQFLLLAHDISERKRLEQMRQDFIANASHELRTPLAIIQGTIEDLLSREPDNAETPRRLQRMMRQSDRMKHILDDLLTLARLESPANSPLCGSVVDISALLQVVCDDARQLIAQTTAHTLHCEIEPGLQIFGQQAVLHTLFSNLLTNAIKHTPEGTEIDVSLGLDNGGIKFEVRDSGDGIPLQHVPRLTERFYRVDVSRSQASGGTGLGLAIVKHALDSYGSTLDIESLVGIGSRFSFTIPATFRAS